MNVTDTWYVLADGTHADPSDVSADKDGVLRHKNGVPVALREGGLPLTSGVATKENKKAAKSGSAAGGKGAGKDEAAAKAEAERLAAEEKAKAEAEAQAKADADAKAAAEAKEREIKAKGGDQKKYETR